MNTDELWVRKNRLADTRLESRPDAPLGPQQARLRIDRFALTANNITYAAFGEAMDYWRFFPTGEADWGLVPVWGFASVVQSTHPGIAVGERLYGFFPMASATVLSPERLSAERFTDGAPHRGELPAVYNQYFRCAADPLYRADTEDLQALLRPLYITSWLIDDFFDDNDFFGARPGLALLSSASSKTAWGTASRMHARPGIEVVGLTSAANVPYCERLGCYHLVLAYEQLDTLPADAPAVYIDFAGNANLRRAVHERFTRLHHSASIGGTHVEQLAARGAGRDLPGPRPTLFFAPAQIKKRTGEWGAKAFGDRLAEAWHAFAAKVSDPAAPWLTPVRHQGSEAARAAYAQVLAGSGDAQIGHIVSLR